MCWSSDQVGSALDLVLIHHWTWPIESKTQMDNKGTEIMLPTDCPSFSYDSCYDF